MDERHRLCVSCRNLMPRQALTRVTYSQPENRYSVDGAPPLEGRSAYVCRTKSCLQTALKGKKLQRSLKRVIPDDILSYLNEELEGLEK